MLAVKTFMLEWKMKGSKKRVYMGLGAIFLLAALVGVFLPIVPQVPFAIIAAFFFSKGSVRIHLWIRQNRAFGGAVRDWEDHRVIRPKAKAFSTLAMIVGGWLAFLKLADPMNHIVPIAFILAILFVLTRKSKPSVLGISL